jgi:hypothetical protein
MAMRLSESPVADDESAQQGPRRARRTPHRPGLGGSFTRIQLEDIAPTKHELAVTTGGGMPEQVAIGYIRAVHRANGGRRDDGLTLNFPSFWSGTL